MLRRRALLGLCIGPLAVLLAAQLAGAEVVERIHIADPARAAHGLPPGLVVELGSPVEYNRVGVAGNGGSWAGPPYVARDGSASGTSSITWSVTFDERAGEPEPVVVANLRRGWSRDQRGGLSVPHFVGKRLVGTIYGYYWLMSPGAPDARFEAVLAFPLDDDLHAVVRLELLEPPSDAFVVKQSILGSTWNRAQALLAFSRVRVQGNLPPKIVSVRAYERGRRLRGRVVDRFLGPVIGARVSVERLVGNRWVRITGGKTDTAGHYSLRAGARGTYRAVARMAGFTVESKQIRAGRG
jgi:hypothetical protein